MGHHAGRRQRDRGSQVVADVICSAGRNSLGYPVVPKSLDGPSVEADVVWIYVSKAVDEL